MDKEITEYVNNITTLYFTVGFILGTILCSVLGLITFLLMNYY